ncbi:MAG: mevalonate kinase [Candidatus Odinarchaeia archaeon]
MKEITASAPAKCILTGEHSVVYGKPALVVALDLRAYVKATFNDKNKIIIEAKQFQKKTILPLKFSGDMRIIDEVIKPIYFAVLETFNMFNTTRGLTISINSNIPPSAGLGSSAAVSVATVKAVSEILGHSLKKEQISEIAFKSERIVHGNPSGIDNTIVAQGGGLIYEKGKFEKLKIPKDMNIIIGDTLKRRNTGVLVEKVRENYVKYTEVFENILEAMGKITLEARKHLEENKIPELGELMNINQGLLKALGVSNTEIENLIDATLKNGALGAKLTGAGGGGCIVALANKDKIESIMESINTSGGRAYLTKITCLGVKVE